MSEVSLAAGPLVRQPGALLALWCGLVMFAGAVSVSAVPPIEDVEPAPDAFNEAMTEGYRAFEAGDLESAQSAFERARRVGMAEAESGTHSGMAPAESALKQVAAERRARELRRLEAELEDALGREDWQQALEIHQRLSELDFGGVDIDAQRRVIEGLLEVERSLDDLFADASQIAGASGARRLDVLAAQLRRLEQEGGLSAEGLGAALVRLGEMHDALGVRRRVELRSDAMTEVSVTRFGALGRFENTALMLPPGRYTAVGRRVGFRDVRQTFTITVNETGPMRVDIRCSDPVGTAQ